MPLFAVELLAEVCREDYGLSIVLPRRLDHSRARKHFLLGPLSCIKVIDECLEDAGLFEHYKIFAVEFQAAPVTNIFHLFFAHVEVEEGTLSYKLTSAIRTVTDIIATLDCVALEEEEHIVGVGRRVEDLEELSAAGVYQHTLHWVRNQEETLANETVRLAVYLPSRHDGILFTVHLGSDHKSLRGARVDVGVERGLHTCDQVCLLSISQILVELFVVTVVQN